MKLAFVARLGLAIATVAGALVVFAVAVEAAGVVSVVWTARESRRAP